MYKGISILAAIFVVVCHVENVTSYCYSRDVCEIPPTVGEDGYWSPEDRPCDLCKCWDVNIYVRDCEVEAFSTKLSVKKSSISAQLASEEAESEFDEYELMPDEVDDFECPPTPGATFNFATMKPEKVPTKMVHYYYVNTITHCCSTKMHYLSVPPSCEIKETGKCSSKVVMQGTDEPCEFDDDNGGISAVVG